MTNYILEYYQKIKADEINVGKWIKAEYENIVAGLNCGDFFYNAKKAKLAIMFIERFCRHHEGELAPQLIKLELWQKALISVLFGIVDADGNRQFREAFVVVGRKNGKTLLAAAISAYMAYLDGEYGGRIYFVAPKLEQAALCYDAFYQMLQKDETLGGMAKKRRSDIYIAESNTTIKPLAFSAKKSDGLNISYCCADELSSWQGEAGLKMYEVLKSSFGARRQPLLLSITTAGYVHDGIYDELMRRATAVLTGASKESRFAPFIYAIDDVNKWNDINELQKSNPNLGVSVSVDYMLEEIAVAEGSLSKRSEFLTKYCCTPQNSIQAWLDFKTVAKCFGKPLTLNDLRHNYGVVGIDLSQTTDLTSACVVVEKDGILNVVSQFWMPSARLDIATAEDGVPYDIYRQKGWLALSGENYVNYEDVFNWVAALVRQYEIMPLVVGYDRYSAQFLVDKLNQNGFKTDDVYQGFNLSGVIKEAEGLIKDGKINCGDNSLLQIHMLNSALKSDNEAQKVKLAKVGNRKRIDGMAALLDALTVRQKWFAEIGERLKNKR